MTGEGKMQEKIDALFQEFDRPDVPGASVAVIKDGGFLFKKSYGMANLEDKIPATRFTNYRLASVSKQFTAMAIMILKQRGKLNCDDSIIKFFPDFPKLAENITVRHLLTHSSGLVNYEDIIPPDRSSQLKDQDVLALLKTQHGTYFTPGAEYRYSNTGYALLALIVEHVSGQRFADFMRENIFHPLGMMETVLFEQGISTVKNRAFGYKETDAGFELSDQSLTSAVLGDGGVYSSIMDYFKWDQALYGETLVSRDILDEAFTSGKLTDGTLAGYGFGWRVEERGGMKLVHHNGSTCGFNTAVRRVPDKRLTILIFANRSGKHAHQISDELLDWMLLNY